MYKKRLECHVKVSVLIVLAIASSSIAFQASTYGQEGSEQQTRGVFVADLEPREASNGTGLAVFKTQGDDSMSFVVNASSIADVSNIFISQWSGGRFADLVTLHSASRDGQITGPINGTIASGNFTSADFTGRASGKSMLDLVGMIMNEGDIWVRIGTTAFPIAEIAGRLIVV
jgi:hypothetical protein